MVTFTEIPHDKMQQQVFFGEFQRALRRQRSFWNRIAESKIAYTLFGREYNRPDALDKLGVGEVFSVRPGRWLEEGLVPLIDKPTDGPATMVLSVVVGRRGSR